MQIMCWPYSIRTAQTVSMTDDSARLKLLPNEIDRIQQEGVVEQSIRIALRELRDAWGRHAQPNKSGQGLRQGMDLQLLSRMTGVAPTHKSRTPSLCSSRCDGGGFLQDVGVFIGLRILRPLNPLRSLSHGAVIHSVTLPKPDGFELQSFH
jgi:hypothetical protein